MLSIPPGPCMNSTKINRSVIFAASLLHKTRDATGQITLSKYALKKVPLKARGVSSYEAGTLPRMDKVGHGLRIFILA
jgi:hypothetical protein